MTGRWVFNSNFLVVVAVPDEQAVADLGTHAVESGIIATHVRESDLDNELTAIALEPGADARRLCARFPLALREAAMT